MERRDSQQATCYVAIYLLMRCPSSKSVAFAYSIDSNDPSSLFENVVERLVAHPVP